MDCILINSDDRFRRGETTLRRGDAVREIGGRGTHQSHGSVWANLGNTPFRMNKHFTREDGISTPFIAYRPEGIKNAPAGARDPAHMVDVLPTLMEVAGAEYTSELGGTTITPTERASLLPVFRGESLAKRTIGFDHQSAHALREGNRKIVHSKRLAADKPPPEPESSTSPAARGRWHVSVNRDHHSTQNCTTSARERWNS